MQVIKGVESGKVRTTYEYELLLYTEFKTDNEITARRRLREDIDPILVTHLGNSFGYDMKDKNKRIYFHVRFNASEDKTKEIGDEIKEKCDIVKRHSAEPPEVGNEEKGQDQDKDKVIEITCTEGIREKMQEGCSH